MNADLGIDYRRNLGEHFYVGARADASVTVMGNSNQYVKGGAYAGFDSKYFRAEVGADKYFYHSEGNSTINRYSAQAGDIRYRARVEFGEKTGPAIYAEVRRGGNEQTQGEVGLRWVFG